MLNGRRYDVEWILIWCCFIVLCWLPLIRNLGQLINAFETGYEIKSVVCSFILCGGDTVCWWWRRSVVVTKRNLLVVRDDCKNKQSQIIPYLVKLASILLTGRRDVSEGNPCFLQIFFDFSPISLCLSLYWIHIINLLCPRLLILKENQKKI